ncbi:MAG: endolytic transglycosylase MltG [Clostridia bacterium]|nr:endolytic transglycosylase MltG [Clostridia bacterium]
MRKKDKNTDIMINGIPPEQNRGESFDDGASSPDEIYRQTEEKPQKQGVGCMSAISFVMLVFGIAVLISSFAIIAVNDIFALSKADAEAVVVIEENDGISEIAQSLKDAGIIKYPSLFTLFARLTDMDSRIEAGEHTLSASMDYRTILSSIRYRVSSRQTVQITIPEGTEQEDIFLLLEQNGVCEAWKLKAAAQYYDYGYSFTDGLEYTPTRLEGYLFPDTYTFYVGDDPVRVIGKFLSNFNRKITVDMKARADNIGYDINQIIIIASMIEKEAKYDDERPTVSSVIHNRLKSPDYPHLQIDATVQYVLPQRKENLTNEDLKIDSPYNTYVVEGLPIGAICNPGIAAIKAALYPEESEYYYYVARINGRHIFSRNAEEHQAAIEQVRYEAENGIEE